jgi:protein-L-isoaspartate(D-aspartate) O-methyltransferase
MAWTACADESRSDFAKERHRMVTEQLSGRGIRDPRVLEAMRAVPRDAFVPESLRGRAYEDRPLPIGHDQTISQPYIVAFMTEKLQPDPTDRILEIGTGSGYQAAVLAQLVDAVYSIEIVEPLAERAERTLRELGYDNVTVRAGDGYRGWPDKAPFDGILVTAAPDHVPAPLAEQLKEGGVLVIPVGDRYGIQSLQVFRKRNGELKLESDLPVRFVPMTGEAEK